MAKPTFVSVTEQLCACQYLADAAADPQSPIVFDPKLNGYNFEYPDPCSDERCAAGKASLRIYHCPFCGGAAPKSKRDLLFAVISPEEQRRLNQLLTGINSVEDAYRVLGTPDHDDPHGLTVKQPEREGTAPTRKTDRSLTYSQLSETAEVILTDYCPDGVHVALQGKYVGLSGAEAEPGAVPERTASEESEPNS
ncbi:MAG: hypothetical protein JWM10_637 [Myxococcaceae bacterium]|nr:hypothetical protein [Myxococcaceae bacterium]